MHFETSKQTKLNLGIGGHTCNWGTHICGLFESELERDNIVSGLLRQGVLDKDQQYYIHTNNNDMEVKTKLESEFTEDNSCFANYRNIKYTQAETYYRNKDKVSASKLKQKLMDINKENEIMGPFKVRAIGEMPSSTVSAFDEYELADYESWVNDFIVDKPWLCFCLYNINKFSGSTIMQILQTHPYILNRGVITHNPFYTPPDQWIENNKKFFKGKKGNGKQ
jgi:hypothetical protein